jgi:hypothetical protein
MYHIHEVARESKIALYGENDRRAPIQHSYNILRELQTWEIAGEFASFRGEGHGLSKVANPLYACHRMRTFLCKEFVHEHVHNCRRFEIIRAKYW